MTFFVALLILLLVYVVVKLILSKIESVAAYADVLGFVAGVFGALLYLGVI